MNVGNKKKKSVVNYFQKEEVFGKLKNDQGHHQEAEADMAEEEDKLIGDDRAMEKALHGGADKNARLGNEKSKY